MNARTAIHLTFLSLSTRPRTTNCRGRHCSTKHQLNDFIKLLVQCGANLSEGAVLLSHRGIQMTARYAHVANDHTSRLVDRVARSAGLHT